MQKPAKSARFALIGKRLEVLEAGNPALRGLCGQITDETRNTIKIKTENGTKTIIKDQAVLKIDEIKINGKQLIGRIQERIKQ